MCHVFLFFFKQKTAYEMRISDWSSDVCSSDLADELTAWRHGKLVFNNALLSEVAQEVSRYRDKPLRIGSAAVGNLRLTSVFRADNPEAQIGRATCRERVCQDV